MKLLLSLLLIIGLLVAVSAQGVAEPSETPETPEELEQLRKVQGWNWDIPSFRDILASASLNEPMNFKHAEKQTKDDKGEEIQYNTNSVEDDEQSEDAEDDLIHALDDYDELETTAVEEPVVEEKKNEAPAEGEMEEHSTAQSSAESEFDKSLKLKIKLDLSSTKAKEAALSGTSSEDEGKEEDEDMEKEEGKKEDEGMEKEEGEGGEESEELSKPESKLKKMKEKTRKSSEPKRKIRTGRRFRSDEASLKRSLRLQKQKSIRLRSALRNPRFVVRAYPATPLFKKCDKNTTDYDSCLEKQFKILQTLHNRALSMLHAKLNLAKVQLSALKRFSARLNSPTLRKTIASRSTLVERLRIMNKAAKRIQDRLNLRINRLQNNIQILELAQIKSTTPLRQLSSPSLNSSIRIGPLRYTVGFTRVPEGFRRSMIRRAYRGPPLRVGERPSWSSVRSPVASRIPRLFTSQSVDVPESTEQNIEFNSSN